MRAEISMNLWMVALCAFSTDRGYGGPVPRIIFCCECMLFMFIKSLRGFWLDLFSRNRFLWMHFLLIMLFSLFYRLVALSGNCSVSEASDLSSFFSCSYYALITEFTIGALNNPSTFYLRSLVMLQVILSFLFLNL